MDPIDSIHPKKDTTLRLMLEAQKRDYTIYYIELQDLFFKGDTSFALSYSIRVSDDPKHWWELGKPVLKPLHEFDAILMRKDPPVDMDYIYSTYLLEHAEAKGVLVVNPPDALRAANEKLYATWFPQCMPETLVTADMALIKDFILQHQTVVLKPLSGMAGKTVFKGSVGDINNSVIIETLTNYGKQYCMVQRYIPEVVDGDKRIFLIDGEAIPYALARVPQKGELRGNLAAGAKPEGRRLSEREQWICNEIGPALRDKGFLFVGIDVIGDYLTEINVTSPTCVRELEAAFDINIAGQILDCIERKIKEENAKK